MEHRFSRWRSNNRIATEGIRNSSVPVTISRSQRTTIVTISAQMASVGWITIASLPSIWIANSQRCKAACRHLTRATMLMTRTLWLMMKRRRRWSKRTSVIMNRALQPTISTKLARKPRHSSMVNSNSNKCLPSAAQALTISIWTRWWQVSAISTTRLEPPLHTLQWEARIPRHFTIRAVFWRLSRRSVGLKWGTN